MVVVVVVAVLVTVVVTVSHACEMSDTTVELATPCRRSRSSVNIELNITDTLQQLQRHVNNHNFC